MGARRDVTTGVEEAPEADDAETASEPLRERLLGCN